MDAGRGALGRGGGPWEGSGGAEGGSSGSVLEGGEGYSGLPDGGLEFGAFALGKGGGGISGEVSIVSPSLPFSGGFDVGGGGTSGSLIATSGKGGGSGAGGGAIFSETGAPHSGQNLLSGGSSILQLEQNFTDVLMSHHGSIRKHCDRDPASLNFNLDQWGSIQNSADVFLPATHCNFGVCEKGPGLRFRKPGIHFVFWIPMQTTVDVGPILPQNIRNACQSLSVGVVMILYTQSCAVRKFTMLPGR